jgi:hypothetical protein
MLKIFPFNPGRGWIKNGFPLFATERKRRIKIKKGDSSNNPKKAAKKSKSGLIPFLYMYIANFSSQK